VLMPFVQLVVLLALSIGTEAAPVVVSVARAPRVVSVVGHQGAGRTRRREGTL
jgi:hypothetical protein